MDSYSLFSPSGSHPALKLRPWRTFLLSKSALKIGFLLTTFLLTALIAYLTFFSPHGASWRLPDWHSFSQFDFTPLPQSAPESPIPPSPSLPISDVLTLEQIRDIVAPTRGFFSRDIYLNLGWSNVRYIMESALLQAELLNRTLILPSFLNARACEYDITVCADYAPMINRKDGSDSWRGVPIEQQMGFRIPISVFVNMTYLRNRQPVITASEYLRLHGQDPESESREGFWSHKDHHTHPNAFETNKTKTPSLFIIENQWYQYEGTNRVNYIPEAMKRRGNLERIPSPENYDSDDYWPHLEPTELSRRLAAELPWDCSTIDWRTVEEVMGNSIDLVGEVNLNDNKAVEEVLNAHGWEVLYTFEDVGANPTRTIVSRRKVAVLRSSIRGFRDDYHDVDADVVMLAGVVHNDVRRPGDMRFTENMARDRYTSLVVHSLIPPQKILDLAEVLSTRMYQLTEGRLWMGAHMRRDDFVRLGWAVEMDPEAHIQRVKSHLDDGRAVLAFIHDNSEWETYDMYGVQLDPELATLPPPGEGDIFFIATDERDPDALNTFSAAGALFVSDLLTMEDHREFGWPLMISDVIAVIEQQVLARSGFFYGHCLSSFAGAIVNMRAARGADPRTASLDR